MANQKREKDPAQRGLVRWLILFCVLTLVILPLFSGILLGAGCILSTTDVLYTDYATLAVTAESICEALCIFAGYSVLIFAYTSDLYRIRLPFVLLWAASRLISLLCGLFIANAFWSRSPLDLLVDILTHGSDFFFTVLIGILLIVRLKLRHKKAPDPITRPITGLLALRDLRLTVALLTSAAWQLIGLALTLLLQASVGFSSTADILFPIAKALVLFPFGYILAAGLLALFAWQQKKQQDKCSPPSAADPSIETK